MRWASSCSPNAFNHLGGVKEDDIRGRGARRLSSRYRDRDSGCAVIIAVPVSAVLTQWRGVEGISGPVDVHGPCLIVCFHLDEIDVGGVGRAGRCIVEEPAPYPNCRLRWV